MARIRYQCLKCKFRFTIDTSRTVRCPNCGAELDMLKELKADFNDAQRLINDSESW